MERIQLELEYRPATGKGAARKVRRAGKVPGVVYGRGKKPLSVMVDEAQVRRLAHGHWEAAVVELHVSGEVSEKVNAIVREVQVHPVTGRILHVDFQRVRLDEKVRVEVPVVLVGTAKGVKEMGGVLEHGLREVNVMCVPTAIPEALEVDVSALEIGDAIHVGDIAAKYPNLEFLDEEEAPLATVVPPKVEVTEEKPAEEEEEEAEPELIQKEKKGEATEEETKE